MAKIWRQRRRSPATPGEGRTPQVGEATRRADVEVGLRRPTWAIAETRRRDRLRRRIEIPVVAAIRPNRTTRHAPLPVSMAAQRERSPEPFTRADTPSGSHSDRWQPLFGSCRNCLVRCLPHLPPAESPKRDAIEAPRRARSTRKQVMLLSACGQLVRSRRIGGLGRSHDHGQHARPDCVRQPRPCIDDRLKIGGDRPAFRFRPRRKPRR